MARKRKPLFGVSNYKKKKPRKRPGQKDPINTTDEKNRVDREKNAFFNVQNLNISLFNWK